MNPIGLLHNVRKAWSPRADLISFFSQLSWNYSHKLPEWLFDKENIIRFHYPAPIGDVTFKVRRNTLINRSDSCMFAEVFHHQYYHLRLTSSPKTILDLGGNAGFTSVYFHKCFPQAQIACVEPMPSNIEILRINLALNQVDAQIFPAAVAIEDGAVLMEIAERDCDHKVVTSPQFSRETGKTFSVPAITVPTLCKKLGWDYIDLLKVDIEGYEKTLFSVDSSWLKQVNAMCIEWHHHSAQDYLLGLAVQHGFNEPRHLPGNIWLLDRAPDEHL